MRILVVEDEKKIADFIKRGLKEEGYAVDAAYDGEQGHFMATTQEYDLIILDIMLPKMDGLTLCKKLHAMGTGSSGNLSPFATPILILTAKDAVKDKVFGLDAGADDYLTKPFAFEEFLARVRALLRKRESGAPTKLTAGELTLDLVTHKVFREDKEIELTGKEYALLEYLMRNAGSVVTRTMISEHVWDMNFESFTNVIDVYINYLRKKIDSGYNKKLIQTVRGRGYILKIK